MPSSGTAAARQAPTHFDWNRIARLLAPILLGCVIWFLPLPDGLQPKALQVFAIFVATIVGIMVAPLAMSAVAIIGATAAGVCLGVILVVRRCGDRDRVEITPERDRLADLIVRHRESRKRRVGNPSGRPGSGIWYNPVCGFWWSVIRGGDLAAPRYVSGRSRGGGHGPRDASSSPCSASWTTSSATCAGGGGCANAARRRSLADSEVLTVEIVGEFLGLDTDRALHAYFRRHFGHFFPGLRQIHRTTFLRQAANLWAVKHALWQRLAAATRRDAALVLVDSLPVPVCRFARAHRCRSFRGRPRSATTRWRTRPTTGCACTCASPGPA